MSNIALLTKSHNAIAAKKKARKDQIKEVLFDDDARREFLTGFHKRKVAKAEAAREKAKARAKQERLEARREQRQMLREKAKENAAQVEAAYGAVVEDDDESWDGIQGEGEGDHERDDEYEDEEQLATVTVVEDFDPDTIIHGPENPTKEKPEASTSGTSRTTGAAADVPELPPSSRRIAKKAATKPKVREKKIRYETKDARKREQTKQRARHTEKAERAGGKASRKSTSAPGKGSKKVSSGGGKRRHPSKKH